MIELHGIFSKRPDMRSVGDIITVKTSHILTLNPFAPQTASHDIAALRRKLDLTASIKEQPKVFHNHEGKYQVRTGASLSLWSQR